MSSDQLQAQGAVETAGESPAEKSGPLRRRLRLNPKVDESQAKAIPSLTPLAPGESAPGTAEPTAVPARPANAAAERDEMPPPDRPIEAPAAGDPIEAVHVDAAPAGESPVPTETVEAMPAAAESGAAVVAMPESVAAAEPEPAPAAPAHRPAPVEIPPAVDALDADMEAEIEKALSGAALEAAPTVVSPEAEAEAGAPAEQPVSEDQLEQGTRLVGKIQSVHGDSVFLDLGFRSPGVVPSRQFEAGKKPEVGQMIEVAVERFDPEEGLILANLPRGVRKVAGNWDAVSPGQVVDCLVTKTNKGGLEVTVGGLRGFLPASQVDLSFVSDLEQFTGQKLRVQIVEANRKKRNLVVSRRACLLEERKQAEGELWQKLAVGQTYRGKVKTIKDYGAFVDIGGVDGFLHVSEISWTRVRHPKDVLSEGQEAEVQVIGLDPEKKKISLGIKQLMQDPWAKIGEKYPTGKAVGGTVTRMTEFGAFVELEEGVEGLIHISEIDYKHVRRVSDVLKQGQDVQVQVIEADSERKRVSLSLKALREKPPEMEQQAEARPAPGGELPRKVRGPLKGGTGQRSTTGGLFGNPKDYT